MTGLAASTAWTGCVFTIGGGSQTAGGAGSGNPAGATGASGVGGNCASGFEGGGGGGGYYGGGGAGGCGGGGGGGSSYSSGNILTNLQGSQSGNGYVTITAAGCSSGYYLSAVIGACVASFSNLFLFTNAVQTYVVPPGVASLTVTAAGGQGAQGGFGTIIGSNSPGYGGLIVATVTTTALSSLYVYVGGAGGSGLYTNKGGFGGGGDAAYWANPTGPYSWGGGGGGGSDVRTAQGSLTSRLVVAGGGGGKSLCKHFMHSSCLLFFAFCRPGAGLNAAGGAGGGSAGASGYGSQLCGLGGNQSSGGIGQGCCNNPGHNGGLGSGGNGNGTRYSDCGGGGGGGYYGGGGAAGGCGGGGGGSSYSSGTILTNLQGSQSGNGYVTIAVAGCSSGYYLSAVIGACVASFSNLFLYTNAVQTYTVPPGVASLTVTAAGAQGGAGCVTGCGSFSVGYGGLIVATVSTTAQSFLYVYVGGAGGSGQGTNAGGFNGGGSASYWTGYNPYSWGGGGGGSSDVRTAQGSLSSRVVVAGGGGGKSLPHEVLLIELC